MLEFLTLDISSVMSVFGNILSSVALILINKRIIVVDEFRFMTLLSGLHFYVSFLTCCIFLLCGLLRYKAVNKYSSVIFISMGSLLSIIFMNLNLASNSVGFYQMSKLSCIPTTLILESISGTRQQRLNMMMLTSLTFIIVGMLLVAVHEVSFTAIGMVWATLAILATSSAQVFFGPLQRDLGMNALQLLYHTSPLLTCGSFVIVPLFEDTELLMKTRITSNIFSDIFCSCLMAVMLNATNYVVLGWASPLTYQVLGHLKTILILVTGIAFFDQWPSDRALAGIIIAMIGVLMYSEENRQQQLKKQLLPSTNSTKYPKFADPSQSNPPLRRVVSYDPGSRDSLANLGQQLNRNQ